MTREKFNELLKNIKDEDNFRLFHDEFCPLATKFCLYQYGNKEVAKAMSEDFFQYIRTTDLPYIQNPEGWLYSMCKQLGKKKSENNPTVNEQAKLFSDFNDEMSVEIWHAMGQLTESERDVVILKWFCGYTLKEAANIMDKPYDTVIKMHNRLKGKLKNILSSN